MWTVENRPSSNRDKRSYPRDGTDEEWAYMAPLIPPATRGGRRRAVDVRAVLNGLMSLLATGCQGRYLPKDVPPRSMVCDYFCLWTQAGVLEKIPQVVYEKCREVVAGIDDRLDVLCLAIWPTYHD